MNDGGDAAATPLIELRDVRRTYGAGPAAVRAVKGISLRIEPGTFVSIVGASGSGKSTLLNMIGTLDRPDAGQVLVAGTDLYALTDNERTLFRRSRIGFVFQFFNLLPTLSALENVMLPSEIAGQAGKQTRERAAALLGEVGLGDRTAHLPQELSGGEMQRVAIARALMMDPPLLLADEPTGNLDSKTGRTILELLRGVAGERTVVMVTHDPRVAKLADRVLTIVDGALASDQPGAAFEPASFSAEGG